MTITILGAIVFGTTDPSTYPYFVIPSVVVLGVVGAVARARIAAGALGTHSTEG